MDPARAGEGELAEGERERLAALAGRFSREDLMRAFDLLAKSEQDIRVAAHPRYHFEMALLKWMHLRRLVPLADLLDQLGGGRPPGDAAAPGRPRPCGSAAAPAGGPNGPPQRRLHPQPASAHRATTCRTDPQPRRTRARPAADGKASPLRADSSVSRMRCWRRFAAARRSSTTPSIAQAQSIEVSGDKVTFTFLPTHRALREQFEQNRAVDRGGGRARGRPQDRGGRRCRSTAARRRGRAAPQAPTPEPPSPNGKRDLKAEAMSSAAVQAVLDVFPGEIKDVEELLGAMNIHGHDAAGQGDAGAPADSRWPRCASRRRPAAAWSPW